MTEGDAVCDEEEVVMMQDEKQKWDVVAGDGEAAAGV